MLSGEDKPPDTPAKDGKPITASSGKPGRYSFRVAPYVFLSDFEVKKDLPLFRELAGLRDQVYRELSLPSSDPSSSSLSSANRLLPLLL